MDLHLRPNKYFSEFLCRQRFHLNRSYYGLYVGPMIWRELDNFSSGSICLVLASAAFDEADYYRDYNAFLRSLRPAA